ncbi:MAG: ComEA family DNA-binding protein [Rhodococcus sp. (in: high G+C Gram-positive bacteria)]
MHSPAADLEADVPGPGPSVGARWRLDPGSRGLRALAIAAVVFVVATLGLVWRDAPEVSAVPPLPAVDERPIVDAQPPPALVISVLGAVVRPGLVTVPADSRIADAVAAAGGRRGDADMFGLNWAAKVSDGDQVIVGSTDGSIPVAPAGAVPAGTGVEAPSGATVSLNTATEAELDSLPGVGPVTARSIVEWRSENGRFDTVEQLAEVPGIGPARLNRLKDLVTP